eukprot:354957-Chlamydomonas_euryale.AAC.1
MLLTAAEGDPLAPEQRLCLQLPLGRCLHLRLGLLRHVRAWSERGCCCRSCRATCAAASTAMGERRGAPFITHWHQRAAWPGSSHSRRPARAGRRRLVCLRLFCDSAARRRSRRCKLGPHHCGCCHAA